MIQGDSKYIFSTYYHSISPEKQEISAPPEKQEISASPTLEKYKIQFLINTKLMKM